ncbi:MAG: recombination mediator RecR [bacterium]|nr:recombination mediator RecR [bacterium]
MIHRTPMERLIRALSRLPGVGEKTATRFAFFILRSPLDLAEDISEAILSVRHKMRFCELCQNFTEEKFCPICASPERDHSLVCVVEEPADVAAMEKSGSYRGTYHILHGVISPLDGMGPEHLKIRELLHRIKTNQPKEIILATNSNMEGEATALHIKELLENVSIPITRLASGIPVGGDLEYTDPLTLSRALESRRHYT